MSVLETFFDACVDFSIRLIPRENNSLRSKILGALVMPIPVTLFGLLGIPYILADLFRRPSYGGSGAIGVALATMLVLTGTLVAGIGSTLLTLVGIPVLLSFPALYYLGLSGFFLWFWIKTQ